MPRDGMLLGQTQLLRHSRFAPRSFAGNVIKNVGTGGMAGVIPITGAECGLLLLKYFGYGSWKSGAQTNMGFQAFLPSVDENTM